MIPPEQVVAFKEEMEKAGADYKVVTFPGVKHSFTNPAADEHGRKFGLPLAYDVAAANASWQKHEVSWQIFSRQGDMNAQAVSAMTGGRGSLPAMAARAFKDRRGWAPRRTISGSGGFSTPRSSFRAFLLAYATVNE